MLNVQAVSKSSRLMRGWVVLAICLSAALSGTVFLSADARAQTPERRFMVNQTVEIKTGGLWRAAVIRRVAGELYLVGQANSRTDFMSQWMIAETIRKPGEAFEGPDPAQQ